MKKLFYLIAIALIVASCSEKAPENIANIQGEILNPTESFVVIKIQGQDADTLNLDENNKFTGIIEIQKSDFCRFIIGKESTSMFLSPGDDLTITIDSEQFDETVKYEGIGAINNNYLAQKFLYNEKNPASIQRDTYLLEADGFANAVDSIFEIKGNFLANYESKLALSKELFKIEEANITYEKAALFLIYKPYHAYYAKKNADDIEADFSEKLKDVQLENEDLLGVPAYDNYLDNFCNTNNVEDTNYKDLTNYRMITMMLGIDKHFKNQTIKNKLLKGQAKQAIEYYGVAKYEELKPFYEKFSTSVEDKESLKELIAEYSKLEAGNPSPIFTGKYIDGKEVTLADFKGQYVYVDVWATWCGPCKGEIPFLQELEKEYHERNVAFVSLSVDTDKEAWEKMVTEKELGGHQIFADNNWKNPFVEGYKIRGIPQFVFIDMEGNIAEANAPRPSSGDKIRNLFETQKGL